MCISGVTAMNIHRFSSNEEIVEVVKWKLRNEPQISAIEGMLENFKTANEYKREITYLVDEVSGLENDKQDLEYNIYSLQEENNHMERNLEKQEKEIQLLCGLIVFLMLFAALGFALLG